MIVPAAIMMIFVARFVMEAMITRQETAVYIRSSSVSAAAASASYEGYLATANMLRSCKADKDPFSDQPQLTQQVQALCLWRNAEQGVPSNQRFWQRSWDGAKAWQNLIRDVKPRSLQNAERDVHGRVLSSMQFQRPDFLQRQGRGVVAHEYLVPTSKVWDHKKRPFKQASDKVIFQELKRKPTYKLFPNVFPSWNK